MLERALVNELNLLVVPVVVGDGARMFPRNGPPADLELAASRAFPHGVVLQTYRPTGISA